MTIVIKDLNEIKNKILKQIEKGNDREKFTICYRGNKIDLKIEDENEELAKIILKKIGIIL